MATHVGHTLKKKSFSLTKEIYNAGGRMVFLKLVEEEHGVNVSRLLGDLDFDSAQCLIKVDVLSAIKSDVKLLSAESRKYAFEDDTNKIRPVVMVTLERFVQQMKEIDAHIGPRKRRQLINNENLSSSSSACVEPSKRMKTSFGRKTEHRPGSSRNDDSFSSGNYENCLPTSLRDGGSEEQLEHHLITARRIDHFLTKHCSIEANDLTKTKVALLDKFKVHEEQLYEMFTYLRNTFIDGIKENIDQANLSSSLSKMLRGFKPVGYHRV